MSRRLPLWACVAEAYAFVPKAWAGAWGALALATVLAAWPIWAAVWVFKTDARWIVSPPMVALWALLLTLASLAAKGALFRLGVSRSLPEARALGLGVGGLQLGRPELRLVAAGLLILLFLLIVGAAAFVVLAVVSGVAQADPTGGDTGWKAWVVRGVEIAAAVTFAGLIVKLSLHQPATVARRKIVSLDALALAEGSLLKLAAGLVATAPVLVLTVIEQALRRAGHSLGGTETFIVLNAWIAALCLIQAPLTAGFLSAAYRRLEYVPGEQGETRA